MGAKKSKDGNTKIKAINQLLNQRNKKLSTKPIFMAIMVNVI